MVIYGSALSAQMARGFSALQIPFVAVPGCPTDSVEIAARPVTCDDVCRWVASLENRKLFQVFIDPRTKVPRTVACAERTEDFNMFPIRLLKTPLVTKKDLQEILRSLQILDLSYLGEGIMGAHWADRPYDFTSMLAAVVFANMHGCHVPFIHEWELALRSGLGFDTHLIEETAHFSIGYETVGEPVADALLNGLRFMIDGFWEHCYDVRDSKDPLRFCKIRKSNGQYIFLQNPNRPQRVCALRLVKNRAV